MPAAFEALEDVFGVPEGARDVDYDVDRGGVDEGEVGGGVGDGADHGDDLEGGEEFGFLGVRARP